MLVDVDDPKLSASRQCELLGLARSSLYERPHQSLGYKTPAAVYFGTVEPAVDWVSGRRRAAAVTPVALRAPCVTAAQGTSGDYLN